MQFTSTQRVTSSCGQQPAPPTELSTALNILRDNVQRLSENLAKLHSRLSPLLLPEKPLGEAKTPPSDEPVRSPAVTTIREEAAKINNAAAFAGHLLELLEL